MVENEQGRAGMDYAEHERTFGRFVWFAKNGTITVVVILILMAFFLVR